jgi:hypothetical protein
MDLRRIRAGEVIAALSSVAMLVALSLPWYRHELQAASYLPAKQLASQSGFEAMAVADGFLALIAIGGIALLVVTAVQKTVAVPIAHAALFTVASLAALVIVAVHIGMEPAPVETLPREISRDVTTSVGAGLWVALVAAVGMCAGGLLAMRDERLSKPGRPTDATGHPVEELPEVATLPAPPWAETPR